MQEQFLVRSKPSSFRKIFRQFLAALVLCTLSACDICQDVKYEIKNEGGTLSCKGYDDKFRYEDEFGVVVSCTWYCAHYKGGDCKYVDLTFISEGDGWYLDNTFTAECI